MVEDKIIIIIKEEEEKTQTLCSLTDFSLHIQVSCYLPFSLLFLPVVAGWWVSYSYISSLPLWESQNIHNHCSTVGQSTLQPIKPRLSWENWNTWDPYQWITSFSSWYFVLPTQNKYHQHRPKADVPHTISVIPDWYGHIVDQRWKQWQ